MSTTLLESPLETYNQQLREHAPEILEKAVALYNGLFILNSKVPEYLNEIQLRAMREFLDLHDSLRECLR